MHSIPTSPTATMNNGHSRVGRCEGVKGIDDPEENAACLNRQGRYRTHEQCNSTSRRAGEAFIFGNFPHVSRRTGSQLLIRRTAGPIWTAVDYLVPRLRLGTHCPEALPRRQQTDGLTMRLHID